MDIGIIGGTGAAGSALGARLAASGLSVILGSRTKDKSIEVVDTLNARWSGRLSQLIAGTNLDATHADTVVIATPWESMPKAIEPLHKNLTGKVVVCMANALIKVGSEFQALTPARGSAAQTLQAVLPNSMVVAAMHHLPARELGDLDSPIVADVLVCGDFEGPRDTVCRLLRTVADLRAYDAGSLSQAGPIEAMTSVLLNLNVRYKTRSSLRILGITETS